jgi:Flp pilus assembly pilin Flp
LLYSRSGWQWRRPKVELIIKEIPKMLQTLKRLVREDDGMEMIEWAIVGVVFAVAAAAFWGTLATSVDGALDAIEQEVTPGV